MNRARCALLAGVTAGFLVVVALPEDAEAACYRTCCSYCQLQTVGCGAGCYSCVFDYPSGFACDCDEWLTGDPCCPQCIAYGMGACQVVDDQVPAANPKTRLAALLKL